MPRLPTATAVSEDVREGLVGETIPAAQEVEHVVACPTTSK